VKMSSYVEKVFSFNLHPKSQHVLGRGPSPNTGNNHNLRVESEMKVDVLSPPAKSLNLKPPA
jgi:hypothetical protein